MMYGSVLRVTSEIGRLREAIVHAPGREIEMVTPRNFGRMLFDDILDLKETRKDHDCLVSVLNKAGVVVLYFQDLLAETLHLIGAEGRKEFVHRVSQLEGCPHDYCVSLCEYSPEGLADVLIAGEPREESLSRFMREDIYRFSPLPNLMFVRDLATVVGEGVILSSMAHAVRSREVLLLDLILGHHPRFVRDGIPPWRWLGDFESRFRSGTMVRGLNGFEHVSIEATKLTLSGTNFGKVSDPLGVPLRSDHNSVRLEADHIRFTPGAEHILEGGSIFVLSSDTILVGCGQRTSSAAIDALTRELLLKRSNVRNVLVAILANDRGSHLDTYFSIVNRGQCVVYSPVLEEYGANVTMLKMWLDKGQIAVRAYDSLGEAFRSVGLADLLNQVGYCAGTKWSAEKSLDVDLDVDLVDKRISQEREWHNQALNMLVLAPGKVIAPERNRKTVDWFRVQWGYREVASKVFLQASQDEVDAWLASGDPIVITVDDSELSRAHGGPRSLVLPLRRDEVPPVLAEAARLDRMSARTSEKMSATGNPCDELVKAKVADAQPTEEPGRANTPAAQIVSHDFADIKLNICSETGRLQQVVLHCPGKEVARLSPLNHSDLLFDDVLDLKTAQDEHYEFSLLLHNLGVRVYEITDLVEDALSKTGCDREALVKQVIELQQEVFEERKQPWLPSYRDSLKAELESADAKALLAKHLVEGVPATRKHPALFLDEAHPFLLTPIPNILFMRDPGAVVRHRPVVCYMRKPARRREGLLLHYVFKSLNIEGGPWLDFFADKERCKGNQETAAKEKQKAEFADYCRVNFKRKASSAGCSMEEAGKKLEKTEDALKDIESRCKEQRVEGGDILVIHEEILAVGLGERTTQAIIEDFARGMFSGLPADSLIFAVLMPAQRSSMHLDTIFTMISENECLIYPPMIVPEGIDQVRVIKITSVPGQNQLEMVQVNSLVKELQDAIRKKTDNHDYVLTPIYAGGENPLHQDREQWCDGANVLAVAPGVVIGYERNRRTFEELEKAGYELLVAADVNEAFRKLEEAGYLDCGISDVPPEFTMMRKRIDGLREAMGKSVLTESTSQPRRKFAIQIRGRELSRARGGPRCMSMPLHRDPVAWNGPSR